MVESADHRECEQAALQECDGQLEAGMADDRRKLLTKLAGGAFAVPAVMALLSRTAAAASVT